MNKLMITGILSLALFSSQFSPMYGMQAEEEKTQQEAPKKSKKCCSKHLNRCQKFTLLLAAFAALLGIPVQQAYTEVQNTKIAPYYDYDGLGGRDGWYNLLPVVERACQGAYNCTDYISSEGDERLLYSEYSVLSLIQQVLEAEGATWDEIKPQMYAIHCGENDHCERDPKRIMSFFCEKEKQIKTEQCMRKFKIDEDGLFSQVDTDVVFTDEAHTQLTMWAKLRHWACKKAQEDTWFGAFLKMWARW